MYDECRFWDRSEYGGGGVRRGTAGRGVIASSASSSHDLMRDKGATLELPRGFGEEELGGESTVWTFGVHDKGGEAGESKPPVGFGPLLMSESGALASLIRRCFRGGILQYGGGGVGEEGVASKGTSTWWAEASRVLFSDGILKRITCGFCASVEECGMVVGGTMRIMQA
jgi:hypothetical protein